MSNRCGGLLALIFVAASFVSSALHAEQGIEKTIEEILVIGTRSADHTSLQSPVPVDVINRTELAQSGAVAAELGQALAALTPSFNFPRQSNSGTSDMVRAGQLRGLSPDQMLVLVNGKRRHTSAIVNTETKIGRGTAAVDFNTIPLQSVARIEVLRDGAGAQYGSDAIAGVINLVLDESPGFELTSTLGQHGTTYDAIDQSVTDGETITLEAAYGWLIGEGFAKVGASWQNRNTTNRAGYDQIPFFELQTPDNLALQGQRNYAEGDPAVDDIKLWFNTAIPLGGAEFYAFGTWVKRNSHDGAAFFIYPDSNRNVREIYNQGFRPTTRAKDRDSASTIGLRQSLGAWLVDAGFSYGRNEFEFGVDRSLNASLGPSSPTAFNSGKYQRSQWSLNMDAQRQLATALPLTFAIGAEYRGEQYQTHQGELASYVAGNFDGAIGAQGAPGLTPGDEADIDRTLWGLYAELGAEVSDSLFLSAALRIEDYSDFGTTITGKLSARYQLAPGMALRGTLSNNVRAPNVAQMGFADTTLNFGENRAQIRTRTLPVTDPIAQSLGARALKEESSLNWNLGVVINLDTVQISLDGFQLQIEDRITLSERLFGPNLAAFAQAQPGGDGIESVRFFTNAVDATTTGIDLIIAHQQPFIRGHLRLSLGFHYAKTEIDSILSTTPELMAIDPALNLVGVEEINTLEDAAPKSKIILTANWSGDRTSALIRLSRFGSAVRVFNFGGGFEPEQRYDEEFQVDIEGGYRFSEAIELSLGITNLLDEYPDRSSDAINFFGNLPHDILSPIGVNGRYLYARLNFSF